MTKLWTREQHIEIYWIVDFDEIWHDCSCFEKNIRIFFYRQLSRLKGWKLILKVGGAKHILLNISKMIKDIVFM